MTPEDCDRAISTIVRNAIDSAEVHLFLEIVGLDNEDLQDVQKSRLSEGFSDRGARGRIRKTCVRKSNYKE